MWSVQRCFRRPEVALMNAPAGRDRPMHLNLFTRFWFPFLWCCLERLVGRFLRRSAVISVFDMSGRCVISLRPGWVLSSEGNEAAKIATELGHLGSPLGKTFWSKRPLFTSGWLEQRLASFVLKLMTHLPDMSKLSKLSKICQICQKRARLGYQPRLPASHPCRSVTNISLSPSSRRW